MDHEYPNTGHWLTVAFVATFAGLRHFILAMGIGGLVLSGVVFWAGLGPIELNRNPVCDRVWWVTPSQNDPLEQTGPFLRSEQGQLYVHERAGNGYCLLKHNEGWQDINGIWQQKWWEVPTKYPEMIAPRLPVKSYNAAFAFFGALLSGMLILFLWLPATLLAVFGRRLMQNARQEHYEQF